MWPQLHCKWKQRVLSEEEHVHHQFQQISLANHRPEEEFRDEAGHDALQRGGCEEDSGKSFAVPSVKDQHHLPEGMLGFLLQAFNKQSCFQIWHICQRKDARVG